MCLKLKHASLILVPFRVTHSQSVHIHLSLAVILLIVSAGLSTTSTLLKRRTWGKEHPTLPSSSSRRHSCVNKTKQTPPQLSTIVDASELVVYFLDCLCFVVLHTTDSKRRTPSISKRSHDDSPHPTTQTSLYPPVPRSQNPRSDDFPRQLSTSRRRPFSLMQHGLHHPDPRLLGQRLQQRHLLWSLHQRLGSDKLCGLHAM